MQLTREAPEAVEELGEYITLRQAETETGVLANTIHHWLARNGIPVKRVGRAIIVKRQYINEYEKHSRRA